MDAKCEGVCGQLTTKLKGYHERVPIEAELVGLLGTFGSSEDRCFEHCVFALINHYANPRIGQATRLDQALRVVLDRGRPAAPHYGHTVRYAALYGRCMMARRDFAREKYKELLNEHGDWASKLFGTDQDRGTFLHLQAMRHALDQDRPALHRALRDARKALKQLPRHVGVQHHYAELVALAVEQGAIPPQEEAALLRDAVERAWEASLREPKYAKLRATLGRLRALGPHPDFDGAAKDLLAAIEAEAGSYDSDARRTEYRIARADIVQRRRLQDREQAFQDRVNEGVSDVRRAGEETKVRHAEMLGFFAGVLALVLTGLNTKADGGGPAPFAAAAMLLMLAGVLIVAFAALSYLMRDPDPSRGADARRRDSAETARRVTTATGIGLLLVGLALVTLKMLPATALRGGGAGEGVERAAPAATAGTTQR